MFVQISTWEKTLGSVETERDYYYGKLHKIELLCNDMDPEQTIKVGQILSILYKEDEVGGRCVYMEFQRSIRADSVRF